MLWPPRRYPLDDGVAATDQGAEALERLRQSRSRRRARRGARSCWSGYAVYPESVPRDERVAWAGRRREDPAGARVVGRRRAGRRRGSEDGRQNERTTGLSPRRPAHERTTGSRPRWPAHERTTGSRPRWPAHELSAVFEATMAGSRTNDGHEVTRDVA